ncbi:hypothetical protein [Methylobacterium sp. C25]|uniref:hypothetical protein n=1 Tax=Methylobacterium sp. C25 TaxID=2721622 RepID=UPI001F1AA7E8|nr:hypothetical protein [Methylobacterium sp. C25]
MLHIAFGSADDVARGVEECHVRTRHIDDAAAAGKDDEFEALPDIGAVVDAIADGNALTLEAEDLRAGRVADADPRRPRHRFGKKHVDEQANGLADDDAILGIELCPDDDLRCLGLNPACCGKRKKYQRERDRCPGPAHGFTSG